MRSGIAGIDHVIVGVRDLEGARAVWTGLGFTTTPRGRHLGQGTANYCVMFGRDYLELLGFVMPDAYGHRLQSFLERREGPMSAAFAPSESAEETRRSLIAATLHPSEPRALGRALELPEGTVVPRFTLLDLPPEETPGLDCFLCGHLSPELMRRPEWLTHANGAIGVRGMHVLVGDTAPLLPAYDRLFGIQQVTTTDAVVCVQIGPHRLLFSTIDDFLTMHPGLDLPADFPLPGIAALEISVPRRETTAGYLHQHGVPFTQTPDGTIVVAADQATGTIIFFTDAPASPLPRRRP